MMRRGRRDLAHQGEVVDAVEADRQLAEPTARRGDLELEQPPGAQFSLSSSAPNIWRSTSRRHGHEDGDLVEADLVDQQLPVRRHGLESLPAGASVSQAIRTPGAIGGRRHGSGPGRFNELAAKLHFLGLRCRSSPSGEPAERNQPSHQGRGLEIRERASIAPLCPKGLSIRVNGRA